MEGASSVMKTSTVVESLDLIVIEILSAMITKNGILFLVNRCMPITMPRTSNKSTKHTSIMSRPHSVQSGRSWLIILIPCVNVRSP